MSPEDLKGFIADAVSKALGKTRVEKKEQIEWLSLDQLVKYDPCNRTKSCFYDYVQSNNIPYYKKGRALYFKKSEIDDWLNSGRVNTAEEARKQADNYLSKS